MNQKAKNKTVESKQLVPFYNSTIPKDWNVAKFGTIFSFLKTFSFSRNQLSSTQTSSKLRCIHYGDIHSTFKNEILDFEYEKDIPYINDGLLDLNDFKNENNISLKDGDLIIADASEDYEGICDCIELKNLNGRYVISGLHTFAARGDIKNIAVGYRTYSLRHPQVIRELRRISTGISVYGISKNNLAKVIIPLPPLNEQKIIANMLRKWDVAISNYQKQILQFRKRNEWINQQLLTGNKRSSSFIKSSKRKKTKVGELPEDWKVLYLSSLLTRIRKSFTPEPNKLYQEIGIRSHTKGIFHKNPVTGESLGKKSVFWVQPNCFVVNIVFAWEHAIAKTTEKEAGMIASHRFPMYKTKNDVLDLDYLLYYFKSKRGKHLLGLASPGGAGRNKTLGQAEFMKLQISVPSIEEQKKIASVISLADKELQILENKLEKLKEQKKGLMQQLLTGKTRIINNQKI